MKNIHVLKTSKPSKLLKDLVDKTYQFKKEATFGNRIELPLNIYITSDEEIKEGDWCIDDEGIVKCTAHAGAMNHYYTKIILTTDQDLIKDGVQAIDDEFLEWFVKNPSCESVEVEKFFGFAEDYLITIPQEEPKQELKVGDNTNFGIITDIKEHSVCFGKNKVGVDIWYKKSDVVLIPQEELKQETLTYTEAVKKEERIFNSIMMKQETLEEVSPMNDLLKDLRETKISAKESIDTIEDEFMRTQINIFVQKTLDSVIDRIENKLLEIESKWQQEQNKKMYSEEDVKQAYNASQEGWIGFDFWFEQFKKNKI